MAQTSTKSTAVVYVDDDEAAAYREVVEDRLAPSVRNRVRLHVGGQIGPVGSANTICHKYREPFTIYGMVPDDSEFISDGWDTVLIEKFARFRNRIGVVSAKHNGGEYVNFPWVSREWIETVGWYFYPHNFHHCCDSVLEILGEATAIDYAGPEFEMKHQLLHTFNRETYGPDTEGFLRFCVGERRDLVQKLRQAIRA